MAFFFFFFNSPTANILKKLPVYERKFEKSSRVLVGRKTLEKAVEGKQHHERAWIYFRSGYPGLL